MTPDAATTTGDPASFLYWAFISHSSRDRALATWLHRSIETYGIPAQLVSHATPAGDPAPRRFFPLFFDRDELPAAPSLGSGLTGALASSRYLIVLCSPSAARSRYVDWEIREFQRLGRGDRILALIVDGEPLSGTETECFPPALRAVEPLAADLRPHADGRRRAKLKLLAGMLGVRADELIKRERQRRQKRMFWWTVATVILCVGYAALLLLNRVSEQRRQLAQADAERSQAVADAERERARAAAAREAEAQALAERERVLGDQQRLKAEGETLRADQEKLRAELAAKETEAQRVRADEERTRAAHEERIRYLVEYDADMRHAASLWADAETVDFARLLDKYRAPGEFDPRGFEWYYLRRLRSGAGTGVTRYALPHELRRDRPTGSSNTVDRDGNAPHSDWRALAVSPDGTRVAAVAARTGTVLEWRIGEERAPTMLGRAIDVAYASGGRYLVSLALDSVRETFGLLVVRDLEAEGKRKEIALGVPVPLFMACHPDDGRAVVISTKGLDVWDLASGERIKKIPGAGERFNSMLGVRELPYGVATAIAYHPTANLVAIGRDTGAVQLWDLKTGQVRAGIESGHVGTISGVTFDPAGKTVASQSVGRFVMQIGSYMPGDVRLWDVESGSTLASVDPNMWRMLRMPIYAGEDVDVPPGQFRPVFSADGARLYTTGPKSVQVWDALTGARIDELAGHDGLVAAVAVSRDGRLVAGAGENAAVLVWPLGAEPIADSPVAMYPAGIGALMLDPAEEILYAMVEDYSMTTGESGTGLRRDGEFELAAWRLGAGGGPIPLEKLPREAAATASARLEDRTRAISADGRWMASGDASGEVTLSNGRGDPAPRRFPTHVGRVVVVAFSPEGDWLASGGLDRRICIRDVASGAPLASMPGHRREVSSLAFSGDGRRLASGSGLVTVGDSRGGEVIVWDTATWTACLTLEDIAPATYDGVAFSPDGMRLHASVNPLGGVFAGKVLVWAAAPRSPIRPTRGTDR